MGNQNPYIEEGQTTQWPREKGKIWCDLNVIIRIECIFVVL
jgi:hypothetical protein